MDYLSRSQPPFLGLMLQDALELGNGEISKKEAFEGLEKEYNFWQNMRGCENGLNAYNTDLPQEILQDPMHVAGYAHRTGRKMENTMENAKNVLAECESGWDFSPRFSAKCIWHNPVDLNCLLYKNERLLASWASELGEKEKAKFYKGAAEKRKEKLQNLCKKDGLYFDYNYMQNSLSPVLSCASLFPYFVGLEEDKETFKKALSRLERQFGLVACDSEESNYQWSAPNAWAPLQFVAFKGARKLGLEQEAKRIAEKYVCATNALFEKTGQLWEKYNAQTGEIDAISEYGTPAMLGWSAGVFVEFSAYLKDVKSQEN
jgi:alpha,alpha-trehalase